MNVAATRITLREYERRDGVPLTVAQATALRDRFSAYVSVSPSWGGGWQLAAAQYVGIIVLDGLEIVVEPKVPLDNLFFMLGYAYDLPALRREQTDLRESSTLLDLVIRIFVGQVETLIRGGIYHTYLDFERNEPYLRGRLRLGDHLRRNGTRVTHFAQTENELTADVLENQILKRTLGMLMRRSFREEGLRPRLRRAWRAFALVGERPLTAADCGRVVYTRLNARYHDAIALAQLLLQQIAVEGQHGRIRFNAFLFDMNQVFELFVARYLAAYYAEHAPEVRVGIQEQVLLGERQREKGYPDIVLKRGSDPLLVLDTKYKQFQGMPAAGDRNQMLVYCAHMGVGEGVLIYPGNVPAFRDRYAGGTTLRAVGIDLGGSPAHFRETCAAFAGRLAGRPPTADD